MRKRLAGAALLTGLCAIATSAFALVPGDVALVAINCDTTKSFSFVTFVALPAGTELRFTDNGWQSVGSFRTGEGVVTWNPPAGGVAAGTVVTISGNSTYTASVGTVTKVGASNLDLSTGGDQLLVYQGTEASPTFLFAANLEGAGVWQADATSSNTSALPTGLTNTITAVALTEIDNIAYNGITAHDAATLLAQVATASNWTNSSDTVNVTPPASFTVGLPDTTAPTVSSIVRQSAENPTNDGTVTFRVTFSENIKDSTISAADFTVTATGVSGATVQSVSSGTADDDTVDVVANTGTGSGTVRLDVLPSGGATITDLADNALAADFTAGASFTIDKAAPVLSPVAISSSGSSAAWAKQGDTVTVAYTSDEALDSPLATIAGSAASVSSTGNSHTASLVVGAGTPEGAVSFSLSASDALGNAATAVTATTDSSSVTVDLTSPSSLAAVSDSTQVGGAITGTYSAMDGGGVAAVTLWVKKPGGSWESAGTVSGGTFSYTPSPSTSGEYRFATAATDLAGNAEAAPSGADSGDVSVIWNNAPNAAFTVASITGGVRYKFPMTATEDVEIEFSAGTTGGPVTVVRQEGDIFPFGYDNTKIADETLSITGTFTGGTATLYWNLTPASVASLGSNPLDTVFQFDTGVLTGTYPVTPVGTLLTVGPISSFSEWYAGSNAASEPDWTLLND